MSAHDHDFFHSKKPDLDFENPLDEEQRLIINFSQTWSFLQQYDENSIYPPSFLLCDTTPGQSTNAQALSHEKITEVIAKLRKYLIDKGEANDSFGRERDGILRSILNSASCYRDNPVEHVTHLFYGLIKDFPFFDGNKRCAGLIFVWYLNKTFIPTSEFTSNCLTALILLIAESHPRQKKVMINLTMNLINKK